MDLTDAYRLSFLDRLPKPPGFGWRFRTFSTGRGWRLLTTTEEPNYPTVREALDAFIQRYEATEEAGEL